ncbi:MAG: PIG-L family deacetylase, partial [Hyphomicrobiales bacterium]
MGLSDQGRIVRQRANPRITRLWKAMRPLGSVASFLNTGAHPDDETTAMLAALAFRDVLRIAYACANRGEGGQNQIGTERGADLGVVRTAEMERAATEIGMGLYWLSTSPEDPIFDFGFSKSGEETFAHWGREGTIKALVGIIRRERPDIVCPTFLDVPGQHGHHRAMTQAAHDAVAMAADVKVFPDQIEKGLAPWQVSKLYLPAWSGGGRSYDDTAPPPLVTVTVQSGDFDPILGATYSQIGEWSRSQHKTQDMGRWIAPGPQSWPLHRAFAAPAMPADEVSVTDGLPNTLEDLAGLAGNDAMGRLLGAAAGAIEATLTVWPDYDAVARTGAIAYNAVRSARQLLDGDETARFGHRLALKEHQLARVVAIAGGLDVRLAPQDGQTFPGGTVAVSAEFTKTGEVIDGDPTLDIVAPEGWDIKRKNNNFELNLPVDTTTTDPYPPRFEPGGGTDTICGRARFSVGDTQIEVPVPLETPIQVLPAKSVQLEPYALVVNLSRQQPEIGFSVRLEDNAGLGASNKISLARAGGWTVRLESGAAGVENGPVKGILTRKSTARSGLAELAVAIDGKPAAQLFRGEYPHTGPFFRSTPAILRVLTLRADLPEGLESSRDVEA